MNTAVTILQVSDWARTMPALTPIIGIGGVSMEPALTIAQMTINDIFSPKFPWKWNRAQVAGFVNYALQQDYATSLTNVAWLERATCTALTTANPQKVFEIIAVRDIPRTSVQDRPGAVCFIPNSVARAGAWAANTLFTDVTTQKTTGTYPWPQIRDSNGNLQQVKTFGTTGSSQPVWSTAIGGTTADGSVVWTMLDPQAVSMRFDTIWPQNSQTFEFNIDYQQKPPVYTSLNNALGIPDELVHAFREGFLAKCFRHAGDARWLEQEKQFLLILQEVLGEASKEPEFWGLIPTIGVIGG